MIAKGLVLVGLVALLGACEMKIGKEESGGKGKSEQETAAAGAPAAGKAEEGQFSMKGPGFDMKIDMPSDVSGGVNADGDNPLLYPGAAIAGMHIEARPGEGTRANSGVELRFTSADAPERLAAWYRDPARAEGFTIRSVGNEGGATVIAGNQKGDGDSFTVALRPASGGGTDGRLTLTDGR